MYSLLAPSKFKRKVTTIKKNYKKIDLILYNMLNLFDNKYNL